ncbi:MAG TPA: alpha/beta hydrolase-fold protein [Puia sp.]|nr:alpha/beta hydrolase-fold protein [Puia sp.]
MGSKILLPFISSFCVLCSFAQSQDIDKTILVDGRERQYLIHLPPAFSRAGKLPLIFALHGGGGTYKNTIKFYNLTALADKNNYIIVYPNALNKAWTMPGITSRRKVAEEHVDDVKFISVLLDSLLSAYKVDSNHVFCTGISRGGMFSFYLAYKLSNRITAIAPVCGGISQTVADQFSFRHPTPVLMINGTDDPLVRYNGGAGKFNKRNAENEDADMMPSEELLAKIVKLNNCDAKRIVTSIPDSDPGDGCHAIDYVFPCSNAEVEFIKIVNGGHTWPGGPQYLPKFIIGKVCRDFSASEKIFDFFKQVK